MEENKLQNEEQKAEEVIKQRIFFIRKKRVMIDADLAKLYGVLTKNLNKAVKRNLDRFPEDFMFQLNDEEYCDLRFQIGTSSSDYGGRRYLPYAFTEHGVAMLSSVLNSERAIQMNIFIIQAFIKMREMLETNKDLALKVSEIERRQDKQGEQLSTIDQVVKELLNTPIKSKGKIGFN